MRIQGVLAYDGSVFEGFQRQKRTERTVVQTLERALRSLGIAGPVTGSGRTDAGVHATGQVIHLDLPPHWQRQSLEKLRRHLNGKLEAIFIKHIRTVPENFHAQYLARERIYRYIFRPQPSIFERKYVAALNPKDWEKLQQALILFQGTHDFKYFMKTGSDTRSSVRNVYKAYALQRQGYGFIYFHANGFLRAQVRMMIHAAAAVADGSLSLCELEEQLASSTRYCTGLAPPEGLYLARVLY